MMPDREKEKVIKAIECCVVNHTRCFDDNDKLCPYFSTKVYMCEIELLKDALALLKEQEKAKVVFGRCKDGSFVTECGHCGMYLGKAYSICPKCNKELDWNSNQN